MKAYLDNAATTPMDPEVISIMTKVMTECYGNPSSIHEQGRKSKTLVEKARKSIAAHLGAMPGEIFFTSGGTEADNMALNCAVNDLGCTHIITSPIEHHAVLYTAERLAEQKGIKLSLVKVADNGHIDLDDLKTLLETHKNEKTIVSLMHANNEIGNLLDIETVGALCREYGAYFHSDTVQTIGHLPVEPKKWGVHFLAASAHKFHGPKGVGFIYISEDVHVLPMIIGGSQERNMRGGTENLAGIVGMAKALDLAYEEMAEMTQRINGYRLHMIKRLKAEVPGIDFNGDFDGKTNYITLNAAFPLDGNGEMLLFNLDIAGVAASGGSACASGSNTGSHVVRAMGKNKDMAGIRFSFGKYTTLEEVDFAIDKIVELTTKKKEKAF